VFGESMTTVRDAVEEGSLPSATDQALATAHYWVGITILALVFARAAVRLNQGTPPPFGHALTQVIAKIVHTIFYLLLVAVPVTGLLTVYVSDSFGDIHSLAKPVFIGLIVLHAGGALLHHFWYRDATLTRMLTPTPAPSDSIAAATADVTVR
jgi:cytochrome b561